MKEEKTTKKRGRGRPKGQKYTRPTMVRLPDNIRELIEEDSEDQDAPLSKIILRILKAHYKAQGRL